MSKKENCCDECDTPELCEKNERCEAEHEALCAWSPDGDDPDYEINRQAEKSD